MSNYLEKPILMNLELTTRCPLRCPQCYCELNKVRDLSLSEAAFWISEAKRSGVQTVNLSGGETMCYPDIFKVVEMVSTAEMSPNIAISGYNFDESSLETFKKVGIEHICVSLNAPEEEINRLTRDGYKLAIHALDILKIAKFPKTVINWVMHDNNSDYFEEMIHFAEQYAVYCIDVMVFKPDRSNQRHSLPTLEQIKKTASIIKKYKGPVCISVEGCYSQMRALLGRSFLGNLNRGITKGCGAGRDGFSINIDGKITPCRHLEIPEETRNVLEYWNHSPIINKLRKVEDEKRQPCFDCLYQNNCLPCMAVSWKMRNDFFMGEEYCTLCDDKSMLSTPCLNLE